MPGRPDVSGIDLPGLLSLVFVLIVVFLPMLRHRRGHPPEDSGPGSDDGWGNGPGGPPAPPRPPPGGIPLDDAVPARIRLRDHRRLADRVPAPRRRGTREPGHAPPAPARRL